MRNIRYIGNSAINKAYYLQTGIIWTPGKVDTVLDDKIAAEMLMYTDVFEDAGDSSAVAQGAEGALTVTTAGLLLGGAAPNAQQRSAVRAGMGVGISPIYRKAPAIQFYTNSFGASPQNIVTALCAASNGQLRVEQTQSGAGGNTSAQILQRIIANGVSSRADVVFFQEGTNDAGAGVTPQAHIDNMRNIAIEVLNAGKTPVLLLTPPRDGATLINETNAYALRERFLAESLGIPYFDPWAYYCDTDGTWKAGASTDNIHATKEATAIAAADMWSAIVSGRPTHLLPRNNAGEGMFGANVLNLTDSNADGLPDNWLQAKIVGATYGIAAATWPFVGNKCSIQFTDYGASAFHYKQISSGYAVGDVIRFSGFVGLTDGVNCNLSARVRCNGSVTNDFFAYSSANSDGLRYFEADFVVPVGTTNIQMTVLIERASGAGTMTGTVEFGGMDCYNGTNLTL